MSTILNKTRQSIGDIRILPGHTAKIAVVTARWNEHITFPLRDAAIDLLSKSGIEQDNIISVHVPGTVELVNAAAMLRDRTDAVIIIGCVIRGDTPHFDYVCQIAAQGTATMNADGGSPVIFGVLTVDNESQALERAGGKLGNKGAECAEAAIEMINLRLASK